MTNSKQGFWILLATILGSSMVFIDVNVVNVALPRIQLDLNASAASVQWVVEAYSLFLGALILVGGSLGDRYGRRRIFALGIAIFTLTSLWCGITQDISQLIIARAFQGVGGALLTPGSLSLLRALFPEAQRGKAIGLWSGFASITSALGPVIGGWVVQNFSWRWVFFINLPFALTVLLVLFWRVPESRSEQQTRLDIPGAALTTLGLGSLVFGLIEANTLGLFSPLVIGCIVAGIFFLIGFVIREGHTVAPMMPLHLFRSRAFSGTNLMTLLLYAAIGGALYFFPFNLIQVQGYTATAAGSAFLPFTLLMFSLSRWSGGLVTRYGARLPLVVGPCIVAVGYAYFAISGIGANYWIAYFPAIVLLGLGMSITVAPLTTTVMGAVDDQYSGVASGVNNAVARIAGLLAIAVFGICMTYVFSFILHQQLAALPISPQLRDIVEAQSGKLTGIQIPAGLDAQTYAAIKSAINVAFISGFHLIMWVAVVLAVGSALCALLMISSRRSAPEECHMEDRLCGDNGCTLTYTYRKVEKQPHDM
ncbi:MAG TPA: MFS transporter [Dictyobacter sp.]|jgi:EmrB/QacA subfamily drug resistance transporter|nr:MFS transporter [Dictyobacter sp.]